MGPGEQEPPRSVEVQYSGPKHSGYFKLERCRMWIGVALGVIAILTSFGSIGVWAGNQLWQSKEEAKKLENDVGAKIDGVQTSVDELKGEINLIQEQMHRSDATINHFIEETRRERLEDRLAETEKAIGNYERQIKEDGPGARTVDIQRLQELRNRKARMQRELETFYDTPRER